MEAQYRRIGASSMLAQKPKIAFLFLAGNRLPLDLVWDQFFQGENENRFSIYFKACLTVVVDILGRSKYDTGRDYFASTRTLMNDLLSFPFLSDSCTTLATHTIT
ncbi:uncharacterized protein LOC118479353 [Helianthus annuus]|uniref:uncharacterized protein LOC118479353 n=1 Tax=Helianthus annuus TaxID=4232 RepID=UPI001652FA2B|nr:uncharacterized protein LOC118479353 [Helianthus annuus]